MRKYIFIISVFTNSVVLGQNLDKIGEKGAATVSGGINSNLIYNEAINTPQFRDPFSWVLSGNVTVNLLEVSLPFTFSFSNTGKSYTQPFNMTALHPSYKKWKSHIGITSMNLSSYTYQGLNFAGGGLEYQPKKWAFKAFGGRLKKAIEFDPTVDNSSMVSYSRFGFGFSSAYTGKIFGSELILFKAQDNPNSLEFVSNNPELTAKDNFVASYKGNVTLWKTLQLKAEIASSTITKNILSFDPSYQRTILNSLVQGNQTTVTKFAYNASLDYRFKIAAIGFKYERIEPEYTTLGAIYFNNDLENITINPSITLFKNKVSISGSTGFQRNNLDSKNASDSKRWVGSASLTAQLIKGMSLNVNFSNMSSFSKKNPTADPFYTQLGDTLNYYQVSKNISSSLSYSFGQKLKQALNLTGSYAQSQNITGRLEDAAAFGLNVSSSESELPVDVYNGVLSHTMQFSKSGLSLGWSVNGNQTRAIGIGSTYLGPGINASKALLKKKLSLTAGSTYNQQYLASTLQNHVLNFRLGARYNPELFDKKYGKLSMSLNGNYTNRLSVTTAPSVHTITIIANFAYQFQ